MQMIHAKIKCLGFRSIKIVLALVNVEFFVLAFDVLF